MGKQVAQAESVAQVWRRQRRGRILSNVWACSLVLSCPIDDEAAAAARRRRRAPPNPSINQVAWGTDDAKVPAGPAPCDHPACPLPEKAVVKGSLSCLARTSHHRGTGVGLIDGQDISPPFQCCNVFARLPISMRMCQLCEQNKADDRALAHCCRSLRPSQMRRLQSGTHTQGSSCRSCAATPAGRMCWSATLLTLALPCLRATMGRP